MRKINSIIAIIAVSIAASSNTSAQQSSTASATTNSNVIAPISISNNADLEFGNIAVSGTVAGTVIIGNTGTRTQTDGVRLVSGVTATAASFAVTGEGNFTYDISLPASLTLSNADDAETMEVDNFTSNVDGGGTLSAGSQTVKVGATLNVSDGQTASAYTSASDFEVTVNYN